MNTRKKTLIYLGILLLLLLFLFVFFPLDAELEEAVRLAGSNRIQTALAICGAGWQTASTVILVPANEENLVDALAAAPLAGQWEAPILVTFRDKLAPEVAGKIKGLQARQIYAIGAISESVLDELRQLDPNFTVERIAGANRWATAAAINKYLTAPQGSFVVGYNALPDALSVASYAAAQNYAIVLAEADGSVQPDQLLGSTVYLIGGTGVVKDYPGAVRLGGRDRYATNEAVLEALSFDFDRVYVGSGASLVDSLAASSLAGLTGAPLFLARPDDVPAARHQTLREKIHDQTKVTALGGGALVTPKALSSILPAGRLKIEKVQGIEGSYYFGDQKDQVLLFTVNNGLTVDLKTLDEKGYDITFQADQDIFSEPDLLSSTGRLDPDKLAAILGDSPLAVFQYTIFIMQKNVIVAQSEEAAGIIALSRYTASSSISGYRLSKTETGTENILIYQIDSDTLVAGEHFIFSQVRADTIDGKQNMDITSRLVVTSSNPFVLSAHNAYGTAYPRLTAHNPGIAVITLHSGNVTRNLLFGVQGKAGVRRAESVTGYPASVNMAANAHLYLHLQVKDQYGDPFSGQINKPGSFYLDEEIKNEKKETLAYLGGENTSLKGVRTDGAGKVILKIETRNVPGSGKITVHKGNGISLWESPLRVRPDTIVSRYRLEHKDPAKSENLLDINPEAAQGQLELYLMRYTASGACLGPVTDFTASGITLRAAKDGASISPPNEQGLIILRNRSSSPDELWPNMNRQTGTLQIIAEKNGFNLCYLPITIQNTAPVLTEAVFAEPGPLRDMTSIPFDYLIRAEDLSVSRTAGNGQLRINRDGLIYFEHSGKKNNAEYEHGIDIPVGFLRAVTSGGIALGGSLDQQKQPTGIANGAFEVINPGSSQVSGTLAVGIVRFGESLPFRSVNVRISLL